MGEHSEAAATPSYRVLSEEQIRAIHAATLEVLETVGVRVAHDEALKLLRDRGCRIKDNDIVCIPGALVEEASAVHRRASPSTTVTARKPCAWEGGTTTTGWAPT